jgi:hypothetical protein
MRQATVHLTISGPTSHITGPTFSRNDTHQTQCPTRHAPLDDPSFPDLCTDTGYVHSFTEHAIRQQHHIRGCSEPRLHTPISTFPLLASSIGLATMSIPELSGRDVHFAEAVCDIQRYEFLEQRDNDPVRPVGTNCFPRASCSHVHLHWTARFHAKPILDSQCLSVLRP